MPLYVAFAQSRPHGSILAKIQNFAKEWSKIQRADIRFEFNAPWDQADIRVNFTPGLGHYSLSGQTECLQEKAKGEHTMNLDFRSYDAWDAGSWEQLDPRYQMYLRWVVIHEFGHALGLIHEHQVPVGNPIRWNEKKVLAYYSGPPNNWDQTMIRENVLNVYAKNTLSNDSRFDAKSVMVYPIEKDWTDPPGSFVADFHPYLSSFDRAFMIKHYPNKG